MGPGEVDEHVPVQRLGLVAGAAPGPALVPGAQRTLAPRPLQDLPDGRLAVRPGHSGSGDMTLTCMYVLPEMFAQEVAFQNWLQSHSLAAMRTLNLKETFDTSIERQFDKIPPSHSWSL